MTNWSILSKKVLERLGIRLAEGDLEKLVSGSPTVIERLLILVKPKLEEFVYKPAAIKQEKRIRPDSYSQAWK